MLARRFSSSASRHNETEILRRVLGHVLSTKTPKHESADGIVPLFGRGDGRAPARAPEQRTRRQAAVLPRALAQHTAADLSLRDKKERGRQVLFAVYAHVHSLPTNAAVIQYYRDVVVPHYSPAARLPPRPCSPEDPVVTRATAPLLLAECMRVLRAQFADATGAMHLFTLSKQHSLEFFTDACTAGAFNEMLRIRWHEYRSLSDVVALAADMAVNAVKPTLETTELLAEICSEADAHPASPVAWSADLRALHRYKARFQTAWAGLPAWDMPV